MRERDETAYNLVLQINEIKPEQWGPWDEQDYRRIDAALRRAKADGVREASGAAKKLANGVVPTAAMNALNLLGVELDARAAQIENEAIK